MGHYFYHTNDKHRVLAYSHYSDPAFDREACIFGEKEDGLTWVYADRLQQWEPEKHQNAWNAVIDELGEHRTAAAIELYLSKYFEKTIKIRCILSGTQPFNGYPWYAYGYKEEE